jgi:hypothetical protein
MADPILWFEILELLPLCFYEKKLMFTALLKAPTALNKKPIKTHLCTDFDALTFSGWSRKNGVFVTIGNCKEGENLEELGIFKMPNLNFMIVNNL